MTPAAASDFEAAVIGGGLVGASLAWGLARAGRRVLVLDEGDLAVRATRGNFALIWVQGKGMGMPAYAAWTLHSARQWRRFADLLREETGLDVALQQGGGLHVCLSEAEWDARAEFLRAYHAQPGMPGLRTEMLDGAALRRLLPAISTAAHGASFGAEDGHVNSLRLFRALLEGMRRRGVAYLPGHPVDGVSARPGGGFRISSGSRSWEAERVVLAAGNANQLLAPTVGLRSPMKPERGQIMVTERVAPMLPLPLSTLRQTDEGTLLIGDARFAGVDPAGIDTGINAVMAQRALTMFPQLSSVNIVRSWRAIRVMPQDGFPIYDQSRSCPGAFVAGCHSGVTLAAAHALTLAPMIAAGRLDESVVGAFSARRFDV